MEMWDESYFNMGVQAYIEVNEQGFGEFQFGIVTGQIDYESIKDDDNARLDFTWSGSDKCDPADGSGWLKLKDENILEGKIKLHGGDSSMFLARCA